MRIELHPDARAELRSAALWYEERRPGLGNQLIAEIDSTLQRVADSPQMYPVWPDVGSTRVPIRKAGSAGFPYFLAFEIHPQHILALCVAHGKRRPLYWISRATQDPG